MLEKEWILPEPLEREHLRVVSSNWDLDPLVAGILLRRGYRSPEYIESFLQPRLQDLRDPFQLRGMNEAVGLLRDALMEQRRLVILGDYDVDGITGTSLLLEFFQGCGFRHLDYFIPNRLEHGYGLTSASAEVLLGMSPEVVVTVDNGITASHEVARLKSKGIDTLITDHHLPETGMVPDGVVVNPNQPKCSYPFKGISGCGVAFKLAMAFRKVLREDGWWNAERSEPNLLALMDLAALGTVADVVPLIDENRLIVHHGLEVMNQSPRPAIAVLKQLKRVGRINSRTLGFQFGPLLNAAGRMSEASTGVKLLLGRERDSILHLAKILERQNQDRRNKEAEMLAHALDEAGRQNERRTLVLTSPDYHEGINGIVASRMVERFHKPVFVFSIRDKKLKGSGRSIPEFHLKEILSQCEDLLERFGGHAAAAGCTLTQDNLEAFSLRFETLCRQHVPSPLKPEVKLDGALGYEQLTGTLVNHLERLQPFGEANPEPLFSITPPANPHSLIQEKHVKWEINGGVEMIGWNLAEKIQNRKPSRMAVTLGFNEFRGKRKIQLNVKEIQL